MFSGNKSLFSIKLMLVLCASSLAIVTTSGTASGSIQQAQNENEETISGKTAGMEKFEGYFNFYWDESEGKIWLEIDRWDSEFLYVNSMPAGLGSNDIGLDRGQLGDSRVVRFQRVGPKVLLIQPNYSFRAESDNPDEKKSVEDAFAKSILWGFQVAAEEDARALVDASEFCLRDAHNVTGSLKRTDQGDYSLDQTRSAFHLPSTKNFPKNTELEVLMTYTAKSPGSRVRRVAPSPDTITVRQRHSFIELPDDNYKPRAADPRVSFSAVSYMDFASPVGEPLIKRFVRRHRLQKKNPELPISEPVEPIIYYVDRGAPEPIRAALVDGARWWNEAFEAAGYKDAFRVEVMPEGADLMDVRYNVIQWVHRSTRGWSYGASVTDPRTGEIIKGHVSLGSQRIRQDYLIAEALLSPYENGVPDPDPMLEMALLRIRQLSAHEVGHTLGIAHNYASSVDDRSSVMDYPHPLVTIDNQGNIDLADAYTKRIGEWDKVTIAYGYSDFPPEADESEELKQILEDAISKGLLFISDADARPDGGAHPKAHLWDNSPNAADELNRMMKIRALALQRFSENNIRSGEPLAALEEVLVPLYMFHRYQVEAAAQMLGGLNYSYALRGDGQLITEMISGDEQRKALDALLGTISTEALTLPERILRLIPPQPFLHQRDRETFRTRTGLTFDPLSAAETAVSHTIGFILHPQRASRLIEYHARDNNLPGLIEVIDSLLEATWFAERESGLKAEVHRVIDTVTLYHLIQLAVDQSASTQARAIAGMKISELKTWILDQVAAFADPELEAHYAAAFAQINLFITDPGKVIINRPLQPPDGEPIGEVH